MKFIKYLNIASKLLLVGLFAHYLLNPDLTQYQNKGMSGRLVAYPLIASLVFIIYSVVRWYSNKKIAYPHLVDLLVTLPFAIDLLGNAFNLFNTIEWWDDLMHLLLWGFWVLAVGVALRSYTKLAKLPVAGLTIGFGAVSSIIWELAEYSTL